MEVKVADPEQKLVKSYQNAKRTGKLSLANLNLSAFPDTLHKFNEVSIPGDNWWEDIPMTLLDLSHNKIP